MGALGDFIGGFRTGLRAEGNPADERMWSSGPQYVSATGIHVTPALAFQLSCWFQGNRLIAETLGSLPLKFLREIDDDHKEVIRGYWLRSVLDTRKGRANEWQRAQAWREMMTIYAVSWGRGCSEILPARPLSLVPLDPGTTTVEQLADRRLRFRVIRSDGQADHLMQERVFRLDGVGIHPLVPMNLLSLARETIGLWLAAERYNAMYFKQGARPSLFLEHPGKPDKATMDLLSERVKKWQGMDNFHRVLLGENGLKPHAIGWSAKDSLLPEQKQEIALDVARWLNIPEHMFRVGKQPTFASIEQFAREFVDYTLRPWAVRWEGALDELIPEGDVYAEHNMDALLRGSLLDRCQAYASGIMSGWLSENEARKKENLSPWPGLDEPRRSSNQDRGADPRGGSDAEPPPRPRRAPRRRDDEEEARSPRRLELLARGAARRVVHRELAAIRDKGTRLASKPAAWAEWLAEFYGGHAVYVAEMMELEPSLAREYAESHRAALAASGLAAADRWESEAVEALTLLALEEESDAA